MFKESVMLPPSEKILMDDGDRISRLCLQLIGKRPRYNDLIHISEIYLQKKFAWLIEPPANRFCHQSAAAFKAAVLDRTKGLLMKARHLSGPIICNK